MKRKMVIAAVAVAVVVVVGLVLVASNLDKIIKIGVEKGGTLVLGVPTTLEKATVAVREGTVGLDGLVLGSPEGFAEPSMFELAHAHTTVDIGSLRKEELVIHEVIIDGPKITLEFAGGTTNWGTVLERLEREPKDEEAKQKSQKKLRVDRIVFSNGKIRIAGFPVAGSATVPLPTLEITDLAPADGTSQTVGGVLADVIRSLYKSILAAATDVVPTEQIEKLGKEAFAAVGDATATAKEAGEAVGEAAKDATEKAKGLLRGVLPGLKDEE
ncbi:MAG: hypothetical protein KAX44_06075 [Candidatus Brocadiae bacterium]|nr:hypothetical protein [Candidatus Brocadiia bacterium]